MDEEKVGVRKFMASTMMVFKVNPTKPMKHPMLAVKHTMVVREANLGRRWDPGYTKIVVSAVVTDITPFDFRFKPREYLPQKLMWLAGHIPKLEEVRVVYHNNQAVYGSIAMGILKGARFLRLVSDYRTVDAKIEQVAMPVPNVGVMVKMIVGACALCMLDML